MLQYKTHKICVLETGTAAVYHATDSVLAPLDGIQNSFLKELGLSKEVAFLQHNLAPLTLRRDLAMLGLLHKCNLGTAHPRIVELFPPVPRKASYYPTKYSQGRHDKQLLESCTGHFLELTRRSLFGLVRVYNFLPGDVVHQPTVKDFQSRLTEEVRKKCRRQEADWELAYSPRCVRQG